MLPSQEYRERLKTRLSEMQATVDRLEKLPAPLGGRWREGMLKYYRGILTELTAELDGLEAEITRAGLTD